MKYIPSNVKNKYEILGVIGEGSYGVVLKARRKETNTIVAIKHFKQTPTGYCADMDIIERELKVLQSLRFENVVELIEWFRHKKQCFLIFEYVEWNMLQVLQNHPDGLPLEQVRHLSYQLFSAIHWCHTHEIIHRDIKPENLLISKNFILKLCDFGFARFCNTQTTADFYTDYVATRWYRSPELLIGSPYGKPVDIWACGCIMAELTTGQALFAGESDIDQLYCIQKCLGPLPPKYMEAMKTNPKFEGLKFPPIHQTETLEQRYGHSFPPDIMSLFKGTLHLFASNRLIAEKCIEHEAFAFLIQKQQQKRSQRPSRPRTGLSTVSISQLPDEHSDELVSFTIPLVDSRLSKWHDTNSEIQVRRRSPTSSIHNGIESATEISVTAPSSLVSQPQLYRSHPRLVDPLPTSRRQQSKDIRERSRVHSSSSDEHHEPTVDHLNSPDVTSDENEDDPNNILTQHNRLGRNYLKNQQVLPSSFPSSKQQQSLPPTSSTLKHTSNGLLLRSKHHHRKQSNRNLQTSSKDTAKKHKRFTLDTIENRWYQQLQTVPNNQHTSESNIHRSSMAAVVPTLNTNAYNTQINNNVSSSAFKLSQQKDESNSDIQQRSKTRDLVRHRTVDGHPSTMPSVESTLALQRASSRQTTLSHHQMVPDPMDQTDVETTVSATYSSTRNLEQHTSRYPWNTEQRKSIYVSDSHLINPTGYHSSFARTFFSPAKTTHVNKILMVPQRDSSQDLLKSAKTALKQNTTVFSKASVESNRRQQSNTNLFGVYPCARTAILHAAETMMLPPQKRQQATRLPSTKSRQHDR